MNIDGFPEINAFEKNIGFQTFYASRDESNCSLIPAIIQTCIDFKDVFNLSDSVISHRYGKRMLINAVDTNLNEINKKDFLEIIDFNPLKNVMLLMGPKKIRIETPTHYMILRARKEVNAILQINDVSIIEQIKKPYPSTGVDYKPESLDFIKDVLKNLRESKIVIIKNKGILFVGESLKEIEKLVFKFKEEIK